MPSSRARALALALLACSVASACGDDESLPDGGDPDASVDASPPDAGDDRCPGELTFEALVADAETGEAVFDVQVAEVGAPDQTTSAPNGRAVLCLPDSEDSTVRSTLTDYLARLDSVSAEAARRSLGTDQPYPIDVLGAAAAEDLLVGLGLVRDEAASLLLVSVVSYPDAAPLAGTTLSIDKKNAGAFARDAGGAFSRSPDGEIGAGRLLLFANVASTGGGAEGRASISLSLPEHFGGSCVGPPSVELEPGGVSGAFFACQ